MRQIEDPSRSEADQQSIDWQIEPAGGTAVPRLVHSGFAGSPEAENEYECTRRGWPAVLSMW